MEISEGLKKWLDIIIKQEWVCDDSLCSNYIEASALVHKIKEEYGKIINPPQIMEIWECLNCGELALKKQTDLEPMLHRHLDHTYGMAKIHQFDLAQTTRLIIRKN